MAAELKPIGQGRLLASVAVYFLVDASQEDYLAPFVLNLHNRFEDAVEWELNALYSCEDISLFLLALLSVLVKYHQSVGVICNYCITGLFY